MHLKRRKLVEEIGSGLSLAPCHFFLEEDKKRQIICKRQNFGKRQWCLIDKTTAIWKQTHTIYKVEMAPCHLFLQEDKKRYTFVNDKTGKRQWSLIDKTTAIWKTHTIYKVEMRII